MMEYSSPLAAMRPQPPPTWAGGKDVPVSRSMYHGYQTYGPNSFDFKTMSMHSQKPARQDYFTSKTTRGSSPTSSLTADLDANFHIDKSPQAPTPRRSLFTAGLFQPLEENGRLMTPPIDVGPTTPPIPSSSPAHDGMDISPLPHKAPFFQVTLPSPTPEMTPASELEISLDLLSPQEQPMHPILPTPNLNPLAAPERRRPGPRPLLFRGKALSTNNILPSRPTSAQNPLPPFRFGDVGSSDLASSSTPSLLESFVESPLDGSGSVSVSSSISNSPLAVQQPMAPPPYPPRRPSIGAMSSRAGAAGSPSMAGHHVRKPSGGRPAFSRPSRKLVRRSLSMFQHPDDVMKEEQEAFEPQAAAVAAAAAAAAVVPPSCLSSVMDIEPNYVPKLPHFIPEDEPDSLPRISQDTMVDILDEKYSGLYDRIVIVDCRFEYEYQGGHIERAVNFNDKQQLAQQLFENNGSLPPFSSISTSTSTSTSHTEPSSTSSSTPWSSSSISPPTTSSSTTSSSPQQSNTLLILHCEYSIHRAPMTAKFLRNHDRNVNAACYPRLTYPEMYILDGGYSKFFSAHRNKCFPQNYVEMNDERHEVACERGMARVKLNGRHRQKLFRCQTFAFGQGAAAAGDAMDESPTGPQGRFGGLGPGSGLGIGMSGFAGHNTPGLGQRSQSSFTVGEDVAAGIGQSFARRMASY